jgi:hypothetical protein
VAEGARLESVFTGNRNVGSNPTPSANLSRKVSQSPFPSNCEAKLLTGLAITQSISRYPQIHPQSVSE